jgi:hypothetical protein
MKVFQQHLHLKLFLINLCGIKVPDGKFYATEEGLRRAEEKWLIRNTYKLPQDEIIKDKIINNEKPPSLINKDEIKKPPKILYPNLLQELTRIPADQLSALSDLLRSLPPPPTSSFEEK